MRVTVVAFSAFLALSSAGQRKSGETVYKLNFQKTVSSCEDFSNEVIDASGLVLDINDSGDGILTGSINIQEEVAEGVKIVLTALKETDVGREFFYEIEGDLCEHVADEDAPWTPLFQALGVTSCPLEAKEYPIEKLQLNLDYAKEVMRHEFVADYFATLEMQLTSDDDVLPRKLVCYGLSVSVVELKGDGDE